MKTLIDTLPHGESCFMCQNAYLGRDGVLCKVLREIILDPEDAKKCPMYKEDK